MGRISHQPDAAATPPHPHFIKAKMRVSFGTVRAWEIANGLPVDSVRDVFRGRQVRRTAQAIADFAGVPLDALFPGRFNMVRQRKSHSRDLHRLNAKAA
jgi:lambda repressor-like predicted transcriptional regulator